MTDKLNGSVLWHRPTAGRGMIRATNGRQYFFSSDAAEGLDIAPGLLVEFHLNDDGGPVEAHDVQYAGGRRQVELQDVAKAKKRGKGKQPTRKQRQAAARSRKAPAPKKKPMAMAEGTMVNHPEWGAGHVVAATATLVSVEFLSEVRKTFKPSALADLSGPDVPKAPKRRKRAPKKETSKASTKRVIRRTKDDA
jgi:hypothetical protein